MTTEERNKLQNHVQAIAEILYNDSKDREPERLETLAGIEVEVREQIQKHVSSEIGVFLLNQARADKLVGDEQ